MAADIASLFAERPWQWGMRGDPRLWDDLERRFAGVPIPADAAALRAAIEAMFAELAGFPFDTAEKQVFVEKYARGGMTSGYIYLPFWREKAMPVFLHRAGFATD